MSQALLASVVVLLAASLLSPALPAQGDEDSERVLAVSQVLVDELPLARFQAIYPTEPATGTDPSGCRSPGSLQIEAGQDFFRFRDDSNDATCAEARVTVTVPAGSGGLTLRFRADRTVQQSSAVTVPPDARQSVRFYSDDGQLVHEHHYLDPDSPSAPMSDFRITPDLDIPSRSLQVAWFFQDAGTSTMNTAPGPLPGQSLTATVTGPELEFDEIPVHGSTSSHSTLLRGEDRFTALDVGLDLPEGSSGGYATRVLVRTVDGLQADQLVTPDGSVYGADHLERIQTPEGLTFVIPADIIARSGPGHYALTLISSSALDPVPIGPFAFLTLVVPGVLGMVAVNGFQRYRRVVTPGQAQSLYTHLVALVLLVLVYATTVVILIATGTVGDMGALPISQGGWAGYATLLLVGLLFLLSWSLIVVERRRSQEIRHAEELARSNRDLEQFAYVASHDLQEPLRKVVSYTSLLEKRYEKDLDEKGRKYLENAAGGARRMRRLVQALLEFSRIGADLRSQPVDFNQAIVQVEEDLADIIKETGAKVQTDQHLPTVDGDPELLHQLLLNLVGNAIKYRHPDRAPVVRMQARWLRSEWEFAVIDNGRGMEPEYLEKAFIIFQRLQDGGTDARGTGIGLALCQRIVEVHGGRIWARSEPGSGSRFYFTLPAMGGVRK